MSARLTSYPAPSGPQRKSGRAHSRQQERQRSKGGSNRALAAPPVGRPYVVTPAGEILPASAYEPKRWHILVLADKEVPA